jgi:hypothetical protein
MAGLRVFRSFVHAQLGQRDRLKKQLRMLLTSPFHKGLPASSLALLADLAWSAELVDDAGLALECFCHGSRELYGHDLPGFVGFDPFQGAERELYPGQSRARPLRMNWRYGSVYDEALYEAATMLLWAAGPQDSEGRITEWDESLLGGVADIAPGTVFSQIAKRHLLAIRPKASRPYR